MARHSSRTTTAKRSSAARQSATVKRSNDAKHGNGGKRANGRNHAAGHRATYRPSRKTVGATLGSAVSGLAIVAVNRY